MPAPESRDTCNQEDVAKLFPGPVLLLAGPGTGKTTQLARRVKWLVQEQFVPPDRIAVITFTDEAARNMRARLSDPEKPETFLPAENQPRRICTMHSLAFGVIREHFDLLGFREPPQVVPDHLVEILLADAASLLGQPRDASKEAALCRRKGHCIRSDNQQKCRICDQYRRILVTQNAIDYDDQIMLACNLLRENPAIRGDYRDATSHLLVDEYQDINGAQFEFIKLLADQNEAGVYAAGDDNQSIYSWRGGTPIYVKRFEDDWGAGAAVKRLPESYRCPQAVLDAAAAVITRGCPTFRNDPRVRSTKGPGQPVTVHSVASEQAEARHIAKTLLETGGTRQALILVPRRQYASVIRRALRHLGITHDCRAQAEPAGLQALVDFACWLSNRRDNFILRDCLQRIIDNPDLDLGRPPEVKAGHWRERLSGEISQLWGVVEHRHVSLRAAFQRGSRKSVLQPLAGYLQDLVSAAQGKPHDLVAAVTRILRPWTTTDGFFREVMESVEDYAGRSRTTGAPIARVLTMQAAKGLEADLVFIVGLEKDSFPFPSAQGEELEEQYRLLYVSMTRAKEHLHLYWARKRSGAVSYRKRVSGQPYEPPQPAELLTCFPARCFVEEKHWSKRGTGKHERRKDAVAPPVDADPGTEERSETDPGCEWR